MIVWHRDDAPGAEVIRAWRARYECERLLD